MGFFGSIINIGRGAAGIVTGGASERILGLVPAGGSTGKDVVQPNMVNPALAYIEARGIRGFSGLSGEGAKKSAFSRAFKAGRFRSDRWLTSLGQDGKLNGELKAFTELAEIQGGFKGNLGSFPGVTVPPSVTFPPRVGETITRPVFTTPITDPVPSAVPGFNLAEFLAGLLKPGKVEEVVKPPPSVNPLFIFGGLAAVVVVVGVLVVVVKR